MRIIHALIIFFFLFLPFIFAGCGMVVKATYKSAVTIKDSTLFHQGRHGNLTKVEKSWARIAWKYFEKNYNPKTGLINSVNNYPTTTMWHIGDYLAALTASYELKIINRCEFDERLSRLLFTLNNMDLLRGKLPNKVYNTQNGVMVNYANQPGEIGWSAIDLGRLLIWLKIVKERYPVYSEYIDKAILRWSFCDLIDDCGTLYSATKVHNKLTFFQEGRLGYEEYAAKGFQLWGFNTEKASKIEPYSIVTIYGIDIPYDSRDYRKTGTRAPVVTLPFLLDGMEFNWDKVFDLYNPDTIHTDTEMARIAYLIYKVQERRYKIDGVFTARTDHQLAGPPYFVYDTIYVDGYPWNTITDSGEYVKKSATVATKAAFGIWALWKTNYSKLLLNSLRCCYDKEQGWYEGRYELTGGYNEIITLSTNAIVLETLLYKVKGKLFKKGKTRRKDYYDIVQSDAFFSQIHCLPKSRKSN
ncbi:MAG: DUF3131 domain-containing protein [Deltaproteobacteria bacterium]|nr:DUF3131 domain-containing protein [Deltaproteobacteria bacterium]